MNEMKALRMNPTLLVMHYEWTQPLAQVMGLGFSHGREWRVKGEGEERRARRGAEKPWQSYPWILMDTLSPPRISSCINSSKVCHLANPERAAAAAAADAISPPPSQNHLHSQQLGSSTQTAFNTWIRNTPSLQKAFHATFSMLSNSALHPCYHSVISDCHGRFSASGKQKRGMEGEAEPWPR